MVLFLFFSVQNALSVFLNERTVTVTRHEMLCAQGAGWVPLAPLTDYTIMSRESGQAEEVHNLSLLENHHLLLCC